jgi:hypothetical protein
MMQWKFNKGNVGEENAVIARDRSKTILDLERY